MTTPSSPSPSDVDIKEVPWCPGVLVVAVVHVVSGQLVGDNESFVVMTEIRIE